MHFTIQTQTLQLFDLHFNTDQFVYIHTQVNKRFEQLSIDESERVRIHYL